MFTVSLSSVGVFLPRGGAEIELNNTTCPPMSVHGTDLLRNVREVHDGRECVNFFLSVKVKLITVLG